MSNSHHSGPELLTWCKNLCVCFGICSQQFKKRNFIPRHQAPFVPRRSIKPLTDIDTNFVLHSDIRAVEREKVRKSGFVWLVNLFALSCFVFFSLTGL
jgi:hypothetical protein